MRVAKAIFSPTGRFRACLYGACPASASTLSNELYPLNNFVLELLKRIGGALDERLHAIGEEIKRIGVAEKMAKSEESAEFSEKFVR